MKAECMRTSSAYSRVSSSSSISSSCCSPGSSPSPPSSPRRPSPKPRHGRSSNSSTKTCIKSNRMQGAGGEATLPLPPAKCMHKFLCLLLSLLLKRHGVFLFAPLIYISGMLFYMGTMSFEVPGVAMHPTPGLVYRSPQLFKRLWLGMNSDNDTSSDGLMAAWQHPREGEEWIPCISHTLSGGLPHSNGYILIEANGGLNQQRTSICNAVAVAGLLNATLVIPKFHFNSIWQDPSNFGDIYDEGHFIKSLRYDVRVVRELPEDIMATFDYNTSNIFNFRVKAWSPVSYYLQKVLPRLLDIGVIRISPFANRLSSEVPPNIQRLRCLANYEALKFSVPITSLAEKLVKRMIGASSRSNGKYIAVHLRFEEDMVAFSCCVYDGVVEDALHNANLTPFDLSAMAVTIGPGLSLCLRVGVRKARLIAGKHNLPMVGVHHMEAHALVARLTEKELQFPFLALLISGGHNLLILAQSVGRYVQLGTTIDDAIGEAYDKTARWLGLDMRRGGGPALEELALEGDPHAIKLSVPMQQHKDCNFSYAGLKTQVRKAIESRNIDTNNDPIVAASTEDRKLRADIAASFQRVAVLHLEQRCDRAVEWAQSIEPSINCLVVSGGVASNHYVRIQLDKIVKKHNLKLVCPPPSLCTDNVGSASKVATGRDICRG